MSGIDIDIHRPTDATVRIKRFDANSQHDEFDYVEFRFLNEHGERLDFSIFTDPDLVLARSMRDQLTAAIDAKAAR